MIQINMKTLILLLGLSMFISLTGKAQNKENTEIYISVLLGLKKYDNPMITFLLKEKSSQDNASYKWMKGIYNDLDSTTISDFKEKNKTQICFDSIFAPTIKKIVSEEEIAEFNLNKKKGWADLSKNYPKFPKFLQFSSIGFNNDKTQAIVCYFASGESTNSTEGYYIILEKREDKWEIARKINSIVY